MRQPDRGLLLDLIGKSGWNADAASLEMREKQIDASRSGKTKRSLLGEALDCSADWSQHLR